MRPIDKFQEALSNHGCNIKPDGNGFRTNCPTSNHAHGNVKSPALTFSEGSNGTVLIKCHADCSIEDVLAPLAIGMADLFPSKDEINTTQKPTKPRTYLDDLPQGIDGDDRFPYKDAKGDTVIYVVRLDAPNGKTYRQYARDKNGWHYGLGDYKDGLRPLFRLPVILSEPSSTIVFHEGEKAAVAAVKAKLSGVHTTTIGGAGNGGKSDFSALKGRVVIIIPDNDDPGEKHAAQTLGFAKKAGAKSVKIARLSNIPEKGDIVEWLDLGGNIDQWACLIAVDGESLEEKDNQWDKPEPFNVIAYPPLPSATDMPPALWEIVYYAADQAGTNTSFSFASGLSTLAGVCRGLVYVARKDGSIKNLATVFTINAALSGEGKSATRGMIDKPLREIAKNLKSECAKDTAKWKTQANAAKMQVRALEKALAEEGRDMSALEEVSNMNHMQLIATPPISGLAIYSQTTPEAFIEKCGTDGFVMLATDEGSAVVEGFGRYSNQSGADMSPVLKAFDGSDDNVARRKDNSYGGALKGCLDLSVQPSVLNRIVGDDEMRSRGFINRFIMMVTPTTAGTLNYHKRPIVDKGVEERWRKVVMGINTMVSDLGDGTKTILLSDAADSLHSEYANSYQARVGEDGDLEEMKDLYSRRHPAYVMRIAAFYHLIMGGTLDSKIITEAMQYAMKTGELVAAHYQAVVGNAGTPEISLAHKTLKKLAKAKEQRISVRDLTRKCWAKITSPDDAKAVLDTLADMGWAREIVQPKRGGRPPSPLFEFHPDYVNFLTHPPLTKLTELTEPPKISSSVSLDSFVSPPNKNKKVNQGSGKIDNSPQLDVNPLPDELMNTETF